MSFSRMVSRFAAFAFLAMISTREISAQVASAALNFVAQLGTENAIVTNQMSLTNSHTQSGVAAGGAVSLNNAVLNQNSSYKDDAYAFRAYGQVTLSGSDQSLNGGAAVVRNGSTNVGLKDFSLNNGSQRVLTFGANAQSTPQLTFNGNSGPPALTNFLASADSYFTSRASSLSATSSLLASAAATAISQVGQKLTFNAAVGSITVFNWDVAARGSINEVALNVAANSTAIINIFNLPSGSIWNPGSLNFTGAGATAGTASRVLWNLEDGIDLTTTNEWWGSILGYNSSIVANGNLNGQIFAENLSINSRELHYVAFSPIPEPSSYAAVAGLLVFGAVAFRGRRFTA